MTEANRQYREAAVTAETVQTGWDIAAVAEALAAAPEPRRDMTYGDGIAFALGEHEPVELELFPNEHVVRITSEAAGVQLTLSRQETPRIDRSGVIFALPGKPDGRSFFVSAAGEVQLTHFPAVSAQKAGGSRS